MNLLLSEYRKATDYLLLNQLGKLNILEHASERKDGS
jgi:hypothetical protein